jgi:hypothetical protein
VKYHVKRKRLEISAICSINPVRAWAQRGRRWIGFSLAAR